MGLGTGADGRLISGTDVEEDRGWCCFSNGGPLGGAEPASDEAPSSSSSGDDACDGTCVVSRSIQRTRYELAFGGGFWLAGPSRAMAALPATKSGWFVLMYAAWMPMRLDTYSDVGPSRSRSKSETTSMSCVNSRGNRCSSYGA